MNEEYQERSGRGLINLLLIIITIAGIVFAMLKVFQSNDNEEPTKQITVAPADDSFVLTKTEWQTLQSKLQQQQAEISQLQSNMNQLQTELSTLRQDKPVTCKSTTAKTTAATTAKPAQVTNNNSNAVTMVSYTHTWLEETAKISLKNNIDKTITKISARISYYDMSGNMLDYKDITKEITIEPQMSRAVTIAGFGADEHYAYYKSDTFYSQQRKYKVKFELRSYTIK